jgi:hypothetical protein
MSVRAIKSLLAVGGFFFLGISLLLLFSGMGEELVYAVFFFMVGVSFLIALEWYTARQPKPKRGLTILGDEGESPLESMIADQHMALGEGGFGEDNSGGNASAVTGDATARLSPLEQADIIRDKIKTLPSDEATVELIQKTIAILEQKGYTQKGLDAFYNRILGGLSNPGFVESIKDNEQAMKNRKRATQVLTAKQANG